jgi:hypothetical protein
MTWTCLCDEEKSRKCRKFGVTRRIAGNAADFDVMRTCWFDEEQRREYREDFGVTRACWWDVMQNRKCKKFWYDADMFV